jgi:hypothetical protein
MTVAQPLTCITHDAVDPASVHVVARAVELDALRLPAEQITPIERAWTNPDADLAIHDRWFALGQERRCCFAAIGCGDLMAALEVAYTEVEIGLRRVAWALERAIATGAREIVLTPAVRRIYGAVELAEAKCGSNGVALLDGSIVAGAGLPRRLGRTAARPLDSALSQLLIHGAARAADPSPLLIVCDAETDSTYFRAAMTVMAEARRRGAPCLVATESWATWLAFAYRRAPAVAIRSWQQPVGASAEDEAAHRFLRHAAELAASGHRSAEERLALRWLASAERRRDLRVAAARRAQLRRLWDRVRPRALFLMPHWSRLGAMAATEARRRGCPVVSAPVHTVAASHASLMGWESVDVVATYGEQCVGAFRSLGFAAERLPIVGNLACDALPTLNADASRRRVEATLRRRLPAHQRIVLMATSGSDPDEVRTVEALREICCRHGGLAALVKPHPGLSAVAAAGAALRNDDGILCRLSGGRIEDALAIAAVVITDFSSVGAQAVALRKPLVAVNLTGRPFPANDYAALGVARAVRHLRELEPAVLGALASPIGEQRADDPAILDFLRAYYGPGDGRAASRLLDLLGTVGHAEATSWR